VREYNLLPTLPFLETWFFEHSRVLRLLPSLIAYEQAVLMLAT